MHKPCEGCRRWGLEYKDGQQVPCKRFLEKGICRYKTNPSNKVLERSASRWYNRQSEKGKRNLGLLFGAALGFAAMGPRHPECPQWEHSENKPFCKGDCIKCTIEKDIIAAALGGGRETK